MEILPSSLATAMSLSVGLVSKSVMVRLAASHVAAFCPRFPPSAKGSRRSEPAETLRNASRT